MMHRYAKVRATTGKRFHNPTTSGVSRAREKRSWKAEFI